MTNELPFTLKDEEGRTLSGKVLAGPSLSIRIDGYGDYSTDNGEGVPIFLEYWQGRLRLVVHGDINEQHALTIDLEQAREDKRLNANPTALWTRMAEADRRQQLELAAALAKELRQHILSGGALPQVEMTRVELLRQTKHIISKE